LGRPLLIEASEEELAELFGCSSLVLSGHCRYLDKLYVDNPSLTRREWVEAICGVTAMMDADDLRVLVAQAIIELRALQKRVAQPLLDPLVKPEHDGNGGRGD
jgi:hypothetical protein